MNRLGPYTLTSILGRGGLGEVWGAVHESTGDAVAIKLVDRVLPNTDPLRDEVEAAASLHHPHIVRVIDFGRAVDDTVIGQGRPYLVMERLDGGSLQTRLGQLPWSEVRRLLDEVLDALAASHARGIIHRDVKPANVLLSAKGQARLADFGLAFAVHAGGARAAGGTPRYMAPEQRESSWRDHGPWTDLHAVGWLGRALVSGTPDHDAPPHIAAPADLDAFLRRLTEPDPALRFRRAADARAALEALGRPVDARVAPAQVTGHAARSIVLFPTDDPDAGDPTDPDDIPTDQIGLPRGGSGSLPAEADGVPALPTLALPTGTGGASSGLPERSHRGSSARTAPASATPLAPAAPPPTPDDWRAEIALPFPRPMLGVGLGLVGLRVLPLVGRERERDALWAGLRDAQTRSGLALRVLRGPSGVGKSRLAGWIGERAHELGAATVLTARHAPDAGPGHGLGAAIARHLRVDGLPERAALQRIQAALSALGETESALAEGIAAWVDLEQRGAERARFTSDGQRFDLLIRLIDLLGRRRAVILWIDDAQWGLDALRFATHLLRRAPNRGILLVLTVRDDLLAEHPAAEHELATLIATSRDPNAEIALGPLASLEHRALIGGLLGLQDRALAAIEQRTRGNPLFAVELIGQWAARGALVPAAGGYAVDPERAGVLPEDLGRLWIARVERALAGHPPDALRAAALAAVLGLSIAPNVWERACRAAGLREHRAIIETLRQQRLMYADREGWHLAHGMLREALIARAEAEGWRASLHEAAARALGTDAPPERLGLHLLRADDPAAALPHLLRAARDAVDRGDVVACEAALDLATEAIDGVPGAPPTWRAILGLLRIRASLRSGRYADAMSIGEHSFELADRAGDMSLAVSLAALLARVHRQAGDVPAARSWLDRGAARRQRLKNAWFRVIIDVAEGVHDSRTGRIDLAATALLRARSEAATALANGDPEPVWYRVSVASIHENLAAVARLRDDLPAMTAHLQRAREAHANSGELLGDVACAILLGEAHRMGGEISEAIAVFRAAWRRLEALGSPHQVVPWINLVIVHMLDGRHTGLRVLVDELLPELERLGLTNLLAVARLCRCALHIDRSNWDAFDLDLARASTDLRTSGFVDVDVVRIADRLVELCARADEHLRASAAREIAEDQRRRLG